MATDRMRYIEYQPPIRLRLFIECIWTLIGSTDTTRGSEAPPQPVLPDGCMELIFHRGEPFERCGQIQPRSFIVGQTQEPTLLRISQHVEVLGIRFHPAGAHAFCGFPMRELAQRFVSLDLLWGTLGKELEERVLCAESMKEAIEIAVGGLERRLDDSFTGSGRTRALVSLQVQSDGALPVRFLAEQAGISERQLEREFNQVVGISPKLLARILRFQRVFRAMEHDSTWVNIAFECGYYDQAHLIADFRQFAGTTPSAFQLDRFELGRHFLRTRRLSDFSNTVR